MANQSTLSSSFSKLQQISIAIGLAVVSLWLYYILAPNTASSPFILYSSLFALGVSIIIFSYEHYRNIPEGVKNNGNYQSSLTNRGILAWIVTILITVFYIALYFYPETLGLGKSGNTGLVKLFDPLSQLLKNQNASQWFVYGCLYTFAIVFFGIKFILKYKHNRYQQIRTLSVMFFQFGFAFLLPEIMEGLNSDKAYFGKDLKNMWPLNYYFFEDWHLKNMLNGGSLGMFFLVWGLLMMAIISPILTYLYGKRWYCSWVCGCGALAETAGDSFRHLSDKRLQAWKLERFIIYPVLVFVVVMTIGILYTYFSGNTHIGPISTYELKKTYGFLIGAIFSGVIGVGFYPILGTRVWCRFGCPMAAILGLQQRFFSRFRITTNGGQCISCGNCSTYCEMGIDVRAYAQKGQNIVRASCVGCGVCAAVCPRGVLKLENKSDDISRRTEQFRAIHISEHNVTLLK